MRDEFLTSKRGFFWIALRCAQKQREHKSERDHLSKSGKKKKITIFFHTEDFFYETASHLIEVPLETHFPLA